MRRSNLPTTVFIAVVFIVLPITLTKNTGKKSKYTNIPVVKNRSLMGNKGHVFGVRTFMDSKKFPVRNVYGNIGYFK